DRTQRAVAERSGHDDPDISAIIVPAWTPGFHVLESYRKLGWHSSDTHPLSFEDCEVPASNLLGMRGGGYRQFLHTLTGGRIAIAALSVGVAQACLDASLAYAKERKTFGVPISQHQAIQFKLADMATEIDAARLLIWRAASMKDKGVRHSAESAMAKLYASEIATKVAHQALQVFGGYGYST